MKRFLVAALALFSLAGFVPAARADLAVPPPPLPVSTHKVKLVVLAVEGLKEAHLRIPRNLLPAAAKAEKGAEASLLGLPTVIAGLALTLAFVSGGFWLVRRGRGPGRSAAAVVLALSLFGLGASVVWADIPRPPRRPVVPLPLALPAGVQMSENMVLEIIPEKGDTITLVVNKGAVLKTDKSEDK